MADLAKWPPCSMSGLCLLSAALLCACAPGCSAGRCICLLALAMCLRGFVGPARFSVSWPTAVLDAGNACTPELQLGANAQEHGLIALIMTSLLLLRLIHLQQNGASATGGSQGTACKSCNHGIAPHFLFNSLEQFVVFIDSAPAKLKTAGAYDLGDCFRANLPEAMVVATWEEE